MTTTARPAEARVHWPEIVRQAWSDLMPLPGRLGMSWRIALLCAMVAVEAMMFKTPEAALCCYLIIFLMKQDAAENILMALRIIVMASIAVFALIPLINVTVDNAPLRLLAIFLSTFVTLYFASCSQLGEQAAIVGLIIAFILTLVPFAVAGQVGDQGLLLAWKMACVPMAMMIVFSMILLPGPHTLVRRTIVARLRAAADRVETLRDSADFEDLVDEGNTPALTRMGNVRLLHLAPRQVQNWLRGAVETSFRILMLASRITEEIPAEQRLSLATALRTTAAEIAAGRPPAPADAPAAGDAPLLRELARLTRADGGGDPPKPDVPFLAADSFTNPDHSRYAIKTAIAAVLCYLFYTVLQWDQIHTAMVTCYVAALPSTGETLRKLTLRITGCLIGATMGTLSLVYVMPHLEGVGALMALVFAGIFPAAWVSSGSERISYAGVQIALAFLLTTLFGFGPGYQFSQAGYRILGILVGISVIYVIFSQFWPRSAIAETLIRLKEALSALEEITLLPLADAHLRTARAAAAYEALTRAEELLYTAPFEPRSVRPSAERLARLQALTEELRRLLPVLHDLDAPAGTADRLRCVREALNATEGQTEDDRDSRLPDAPDAYTADTHDDSIEARLCRLEEIAKV